MDGSLDDLIYEVRVFYQSLVQVVEELHSDQNMSLGMRAVLEYLLKNGAATVPTMARNRRVTRQRIQTLVNQLLEVSLVESQANPASKRSSLIALTTEGRQTISAMRRKEGSLFYDADISKQRVSDAYNLLREVRLKWESRG